MPLHEGGVNQRDAAATIGISRTWLRVLEWRALVKVSAATGGDAPPMPKWMHQYTRAGRRGRKRDYRKERERAWARREQGSTAIR
jgi:hypothetical protein